MLVRSSCAAAMSTRNHLHTLRAVRVQMRPRLLSSQARPPSPHARFYTDYAAGMIPVALLGSAVYIGLRTWQQHLAHERFLEEAHAHVQQLEAEVIAQRELLKSPPHAAQSPVSDAPAEAKKRKGWLPW
ncbi:hypothetical protein BD311DRAFT_751287 [Dichomitus squalens]|uniref:Uncharacterized protein n=1 Tax=Dichomitus squalens TaxID=114155 RepID=A0A4Q9MVT8_9APHY|nr:hypothetical protein BD311DRAFT_751287 [Dichomitus squalens]